MVVHLYRNSAPLIIRHLLPNCMGNIRLQSLKLARLGRCMYLLQAGVEFACNSYVEYLPLNIELNSSIFYFLPKVLKRYDIYLTSVGEILLRKLKNIMSCQGQVLH